MTYGILILIPLVLLIAFLSLTAVESRTGRRFLAGRRFALDAKVSRYMFIIRHVDWGAVSADLVKSFLERATHDIAHGALIGVRALERSLTRVVRSLRSREENPVLPPPPPTIEQSTRIERITTSVKTAVRRSRKRPTIHAAHVEEGE